MIKTDTVIARFGGTCKTAEFFGVSPQAVSLWRRTKKKAIPRVRELELMMRLPKEFPPEHTPT